MAFTQTHQRTVNDGTATLAGDPIVIVTDGQNRRDYEWSSAPTNVEIDIDFVISRVKSVFLLSTQAATLKTNSSGSPDTTITLPAGRVTEWTNLDGTTNPFGSVDVTKVFFTSATAAGALKIRIGYDSTP